MVVSETDIVTQGEVESPLQSEQKGGKNHNNVLPSLGRQSSIYSLTLDEFQHTLCESGKNFGSMNMDEFLNSIWTAEENQAVNSNNNAAATGNNNNSNNANNGFNLGLSDQASSEKPITQQPSLPRQGSLTLPAPLCRKTVDEVWTEIHKGKQGQQQSNNNVQSSGSAPRQPTFGEMTLEDFLVKAGVVREQSSGPAPPPIPPPTQQQYGLYPNNNYSSMGGPTFVTRPPIMGAAPGGSAAGAGGVGAGFPTLTHGGGGVGESSNFSNRNGAYPPPVVCYGGNVGNGGGGYGPPQGMGVEPTVSPVSSDGMCGSQVDNAMNQYGMDIGGPRGRKRIIDGPVEKVVERRQRRMIKNRESAARSRARKQAYTVELEAELNLLREENAHLKQTLAEMERKREQQYFEEVKMRAQTRAQKAREKLRVMRRTLSCTL